MAEMISLVAVPDRKLPREDARGRYVEGTDAEPLTVPASAYYRRAIERGDVREAVPLAAPKAKG